MASQPPAGPDRIRTLFPTTPGTFILRNPTTGDIVAEIPWLQPPVAPETHPTTPGITVSALKRGALGLAGDFATTGGLVAEALGSDEYSEAFYAKAKEYQDRSAVYEPTIGSVENIKSVGDVAVFAWETLVENAPMLASLIIPGGVASKGAQLLGASQKGASLAGAAAAFASDVGLQTGESGNIAREEGASAADLRVVGSGLGKAILDFAPVFAIAKRMGLLKGIPLTGSLNRFLVGSLSNGGYLRRAAGHAGAIVAREVPTEVAQEYINIALQRTFSEYEGEYTKEEWSQLFNAAAGATAFGLLGIPAGLRRARPERTGPPPGDTPEGLDNQPAETKPITEGTLGEPPGGSGGGGGAQVDITGTGAETETIIDPRAPTATSAEIEPPPAIDAVLPPQEPIAAEPQQRDAAKDAIVEEPTTVTEETIVDVEGKVVQTEISDPMLEKDVEVTGPISEGLARTKEQLEVAARYPEYAEVDPGTPEGQSLAALHPGLQRLLQTREEVVADEENYRQTDGRLKVRAQKKLDTIDIRIKTLEERLGLAPLNTAVQPASPQAVQDPEPEPELKPVGLSPAQTTRLARLADKEATEGLTTAETDIMHELQQIAIGAITPGERQRTVTSIRAEINSLIAEIKQVNEATEVADFPARLQPRGEGIDPTTTEGGLTGQGAGFLQLRLRLKQELQLMRASAQKELAARLRTEAEDAGLLDELGPDDTLQSGGVSHIPYSNLRPGSGMDRATAEKWIRRIVGVFIIGPKVRLISNSHPEVQRLLRTKRPNSILRGFWQRGEATRNQVTLIHDNHTTVKDLFRTYLHEALGHYGLRTILSVEQFQELRASLIKNPPPGYAEQMKRLKDIRDESGIQRDEQKANVQRDQLAVAKIQIESGDGAAINRHLSREDINALSGITNPEEGLAAAQARALANLAKDEQTIQDNFTAIDIYKDQQEAQVAEEYVAEFAEGLILDPKSGVAKMGWFKIIRAAWRQRNLKEGKALGITWTDEDLYYALRNVSKVFVGKRQAQYVPGEGEQARGLGATGQYGSWYSIDALSEIMGSENGAAASRDIGGLFGVWGARYRKLFFTPLQFAEKYKVPGSAEFLEFVQQWWARKRTLTDQATILTQEFLQYGPRDQRILSQVILEMSIKSDEVGRRLTPEEENEVFKKAGMENDDALIQLWRDMDGTFQTVVQQLRKGLETIAIRTHGARAGESKRTREDAEALQRRWQQARKGSAKLRGDFMTEVGTPTYLRLLDIDKEIQGLEQRNYFPRMRFGQWIITVRARTDLTFEDKTYNGPTGDKRGEVVYFEGFSNPRAQKQFFEELKARFPKDKYEMQAGKLSDEEFHFMGTMSPQLYEQLLDAIPSPTGEEQEAMSESMKETLRELYLKQAPGRSFLRHLTKRAGIAGYSEDVLRVYSSYIMNAANHIARLEFHLDMRDQLAVIKKHAATTIPDARIEGIVSEYFQKQYEYIMNPKNDLAHLRAWGFLWYLGFNVKSAAVNLTQVPMVLYPYLASRYGDVSSSAAILDATQLVARKYRDGEILGPELTRALERAVREGFVEESRATELAALGENHVLQRLIPGTTQGRMLARASYYGAFMFQKAERFNREVSFIAAYKLAKSNGVSSEEEAFKLGRKAVQTAMFEYAKWNRPLFMRGKKSVFFLFWQFMQGMAYMGFGGAGGGSAMRLWMTLLLAGGIQGLPFMENILDILDFTGTKAKEYLGFDNPMVDLRTDLRALAAELTERPDMVMHGLSRQYGLGPLHLLGLLDVPVPHVDISGSLSAGRVIPGTQDLFGAERDPSAKLGRVMADVFGPVASIPYQFWRAAMDTDPDTLKRWERTMPSAMRNMTKALRRAGRGEESYRGGGSVSKFDWQDTEQRAELIAQFLGFSTTRVNQRYEADYAIRNVTEYWAIRRAIVMENVAYARMAGDNEVVADSIAALKRFNESTPDPALKINSTQLLQSLRQRFQRASLRERGIPSELLYRRIVRTMRELYPETAVVIE